MNILNRLGTWWTCKIPHGLAITLLIVLGNLIFLPTLHYAFIFDDYPTILEHHLTYMTPFGGLFFSSSRWISRVLHKCGFMIGGMEPIGFRIINLIVHVSSGILLYVLLVMILQRLDQEWFRARARLIALLAAILFIIHPAQTQTATYITQMSTEGLAGLITILVTTLFVRGVLCSSIGEKLCWYAMALYTTYVGAGSKEIIVVLPVLILFLDFTLLAQINWKQFFWRLPIHGLIATTLFFGLARVGMHVQRVAREAPQLTVPSNRGAAATDVPKGTIHPNLYRWTQPKILFHYLTIFFWPRNLCFEYDIKIVSTPIAPDVFIPLLMWLIIIGGLGILAWRKKNLPIVFGIGWFLAVMLPRAIAPSQELVCDYKTYLASLGIMLIIASLLLYIIEYLTETSTTARQTKRTCSLLIIVVLMMVGAYTRNLVWRNEQTFWHDVITKFPARARAHNNLAIAYLEQGNIPQALVHFTAAIQYDGTYGEPHVNLALMYERIGNAKKAAHHYHLALASGEMHPQLFYNLGIFNKNLGDLNLAEQNMRQAVELRPFFPQARHILAQILYSKKQYAETIKLCEETFMLQATDKYPFNKIYGLALFDSGKLSQAIQPLQACNPQEPDIAFALGCCFLDSKKFAAAAQHLATAYTYNRHDIGVAYNLGQALLATKEYAKALESFGRCNNVINELPFVPLFQARCHQGLGNSEEATRLLKNIIQTNKNEAVRKDAQRFLKNI